MIVRLTPWLYQGDVESVANHEYKKYFIKKIICLNENNERAFPEYEIDYLWCPFNDPGENLTFRKLQMIANFFNDDHPTLIHCFGGANRSSAICSLLLSGFFNFTYERTIHDFCSYVKERNPRMGIRDELIEKIYDLTGIRLENP